MSTSRILALANFLAIIHPNKKKKKLAIRFLGFTSLRKVKKCRVPHIQIWVGSGNKNIFFNGALAGYSEGRRVKNGISVNADGVVVVFELLIS